MKRTRSILRWAMTTALGGGVCLLGSWWIARFYEISFGVGVLTTILSIMLLMSLFGDKSKDMSN